LRTTELHGELWEGRDSMHSFWFPWFLILRLVHIKGSISILLSEWCFDYLMTKNHIIPGWHKGEGEEVCSEEFSMSDLCWGSRFALTLERAVSSSSWG